jgi:hypothetical protein
MVGPCPVALVEVASEYRHTPGDPCDALRRVRSRLENEAVNLLLERAVMTGKWRGNETLEEIRELVRRSSLAELVGLVSTLRALRLDRPVWE